MVEGERGDVRRGWWRGERGNVRRGGVEGREVM